MEFAPQILFLFAIVVANRLGFVYVVHRRLHLSLVRNPVLTFLYFVAMTGAIVLLFPAYAAPLYAPSTVLTPVFCLFVLFVVNPWAYRRLIAAGTLPKRLAALYPDQAFLMIDERYLLSKTGDVLFQQTALGILALMLVGAGMPFTTLVPLFALVFALLHAHLYLSMPFVWATYFTVCAVASGFILPFLLLLVPGGVYYAIILHTLWYVGSGALFGSIEQMEIRAAR